MSRIGGDFELVANSEICFPKFLLGQNFVCDANSNLSKKIVKFIYDVFALKELYCHNLSSFYILSSISIRPSFLFINVLESFCKIVYSLKQKTTINLHTYVCCQALS